MRNILVIGAGRFGSNLAKKLTELGNEVMVVDKDEASINEVTDHATRAQIGNCLDKDVLRALGVRNFDICFVCISEDFQSSMEITSMLKEFGAAYVVSKADRTLQAELLKKIGADEVVYPERDMAHRTAVRYSTKGAFDYFELSSEYAIFEITPPKVWIGKNLRDLDIRTRHQVNVIGVKDQQSVTPILSADHVFRENEHIIIAGEKESILDMMNK